MIDLSMDCELDRHHLCASSICKCSCHPKIVIDERKGIPDLLSSLDKIRELHLKKNEDYADANNAFSNFEFTEFVLRSFNNDRDKTYVWPIATKLARLGSLLSSNREPNNESIEDSLLDIATYVLLWKADISRRTLNLTDQTSY